MKLTTSEKAMLIINTILIALLGIFGIILPMLGVINGRNPLLIPLAVFVLVFNVILVFMIVSK